MKCSILTDCTLFHYNLHVVQFYILVPCGSVTILIVHISKLDMCLLIAKELYRCIYICQIICEAKLLVASTNS